MGGKSWIAAKFVAGASVGAAATVSVYPKPAIAQGARELKMVTIWPKGLPGLQTGADRVAQSITAVGRPAASQGVPRRPAGRCHGIVRCRLFRPRRSLLRFRNHRHIVHRINVLRQSGGAKQLKD